MDNLKQQIKVLQSQTKTSLSSQKTISDLEHHARQQKDTIARLEVRIAELQSIASIGYHAINKWRSKVYQ